MPVSTEPSAVNPRYCQWPRLLARYVSSFFATKCAPESGLHPFMALTKYSEVCFRADSGVSDAYVMWLQREWERLTGEDVLGFDQSLMSDYGRMVYLEYPALLARMRAALAANVRGMRRQGRPPSPKC